MRDREDGSFNLLPSSIDKSLPLGIPRKAQHRKCYLYSPNRPGLSILLKDISTVERTWRCLRATILRACLTTPDSHPQKTISTVINRDFEILYPHQIQVKIVASLIARHPLRALRSLHVLRMGFKELKFIEKRQLPLMIMIEEIVH
jgi:hypothetical protein